MLLRMKMKQVVNHGQGKASYQLPVKHVVAIGNAGVDVMYIMLQYLSLLFGERNYQVIKQIDTSSYAEIVCRKLVP